MGGVVDLGRRCIRHNGASEMVELIKAEGHQLCARTAALPEHERPHAPLLMAELMDSGALGEGLLPLAYEARVSGLLAPDAQILPCRLRVWAFVAELRACGTALDGCELVASHVGGTRTLHSQQHSQLHSQQQAVAARAPSISRGSPSISLAPWRAYHEMKSYASIDLPSSEYTPLSLEALVLDAELGQPPPADGCLLLAALCAGRANAVIWTWEIDLDETGASLTNAPRAPKTHWRQAAHLLSGHWLSAEQPMALSFRAISNGRELRFELDVRDSNLERASAPLRTRPHAPRFLRSPPAEPRIDVSPTAGSPAAPTLRSLRSASGLLPGEVLPSSAAPTLCVDDPRISHAEASRGSGGGGGGRRCQSTSWRHRRPRVLMPPLSPEPVDPEWREAMELATVRVVERFGLSPRGAEHSISLCEAALEIAANPALFGVHPADALQAVRLYYAN